MSIFGIKKNEYGGGTLTPVEGGGGGSITLYTNVNYGAYLFKDPGLQTKVTANEMRDMYTKYTDIEISDLYERYISKLAWIKANNENPYCSVGYIEYTDVSDSASCIVVHTAEYVQMPS